MEFVKTTINNHVATVRFSRGDNLNTLNTQALKELRDTARELADIPDLSVVILYGDPVFSAGADFEMVLNPGRAESGSGDSLLEQRHEMKLGPDLCQAWEDIEAYTIAAIEGFCLGGASALACALDYRIMAKGAHMRLPEIELGINMSWHTIPRLVAQIGPARAKQYLILCERIEAEQALAWGLCEDVVDDGQTLTAAEDYAARVRMVPTLGVRMSKQAVNAAAYALAKASTFMDRDQSMMSIRSKDHQDKVQELLKKSGQK
jgi:enoyl-CoA hydratase/carnithine racemase